MLIAFLLVNAHRALAIEPSSADTLRLAGCYKEAEKAYPLRDKIELQESITDLKLSNFTAQYLPQLSLTGKATYQSQVLELPFKIPGATTPEFYKDNYQVSLNLDQLIYDGGAIGSQRGIARTQKELEQQSVAVELYKLRDRVNDAFFNVLLLQEQEKSLMSLKEALTSKLDLLRSQVKNGLAVESAADAVDAELKKTEQSLV
ncbi:MAG: TolC family protein, partial [Chlorobiales bacterium]|nr:TolC family protein [Chlorobiales bacterium]